MLLINSICINNNLSMLKPLDSKKYLENKIAYQI